MGEGLTGGGPTPVGPRVAAALVMRPKPGGGIAQVGLRRTEDLLNQKGPDLVVELRRWGRCGVID